MTTFSLQQNRRLRFENEGDKVRIVVFENNTEWVCRKESFRNLERFLSEPEAHIFKGRLQLLKHGDKISVEVKGEGIGVVDAGEVGKGLEELRNALLA